MCNKLLTLEAVNGLQLGPLNNRVLFKHPLLLIFSLILSFNVFM